MENVFETVLAGTTETESESVSTNTDTSELGSEYDLDLSEITEEQEETEAISNDDTNEDEYEEAYENPTNQAFAQMRVQNKEYSTKINELDAIAKASGLNGVDDLIAKAKEAQIRNEAKSKGISEDVARELAEMRDFREQYEQDKADAAFKAKETTFVNNLQSFITDNKLSKTAVDKLSNDISKDGLTNEYLMELPKSALNRILSSYVGTDIQKNLERKEAIKNELPLNQTSKIDTQSVNKQIDDLAKQWAGRI